jgi:rubredoxin
MTPLRPRGPVPRDPIQQRRGRRNMKAVRKSEWECLQCGYGYEGRKPPRRCPDCHAVGSWQGVDDLDDGDDNWSRGTRKKSQSLISAWPETGLDPYATYPPSP